MILRSTWLIRAGIAIGGVALGNSDGQVRKLLGAPAASDAAMGHYWSTWTENGHHLDIYSVRGDQAEGKVMMVRVDSPKFQTKRGVGPGCFESAVMRMYPRAKRVASYLPAGQRPPILVLDDVRHGIAFEVRQGRCVAVTVHKKGDRVVGQYIPLTAVVGPRAATK